MSFREKSAWITFLCLLAFFGAWLANLVRVEIYGVRHPHPASWLVFAVGAFVLAEVVLHLAIAFQSPRDARTPKDEREKLIDLKAVRVAFWVVMTGAVASVGTLHLGFDRVALAQCVFGSVLLGELVNYGTRIVLYRRDA